MVQMSKYGFGCFLVSMHNDLLHTQKHVFNSAHPENLPTYTPPLAQSIHILLHLPRIPIKGALTEWLTCAPATFRS